eukprot:scaffold100703_cov33-Phaeocystis_antarctica.AAC.2
MRQTCDRRPACGANHHGGGGVGQPPADAIEASALRARPRWREGAARPAPPATGQRVSSVLSKRSSPRVQGRFFWPKRPAISRDRSKCARSTAGAIALRARRLRRARKNLLPDIAAKLAKLSCLFRQCELSQIRDDSRGPSSLPFSRS